MILAVTGFTPIPDHPRSVNEYAELGYRLIDTGIPLVIAMGDLELCWLYKYLHERGETFTHSVADNPRKNSIAYHIVQAQKFEWLVEAAEHCCSVHKPDVLVWIDLGIFHLPGVTSDIIRDFLQRAASEQTIAIPGCWDRDYEYSDERPCWRFCGGLMVVPFRFVDRFYAIVQQEYKRWLEQTGNLSWEVNTLARVEQQHPNLIWHYKADHNASMFLNYQATEMADGYQKAV